MSATRGPKGLTIRPFDGSDADYEATAAIWTANWPDEPSSQEGTRYADATREKKYFFQRWMVELDGEIVATAIASEPEWCYGPGKYDIQVRVLPEFQKRGIGGTLYAYVMDRLNELEHKPANLHADAREDQPHSVKFLTDRGFEQKQRQQVSRLDVASFDAAPFAGSIKRFEESGLTMKTLEELEAEDPEGRRKAYEKYVELFQDVPIFEDRIEISYEMFERELGAPNRIPGAITLVFDGDEIVGTTSLWKRLADPGNLGTGLTAVARSHRRRGIATALKVGAIEFARSLGTRVIQTDNEENNPMYDLNVRLGFRPVPAWLIFQKLQGEMAEAAGSDAGVAAEETS
ncbi:MAG: GNAT family N-acetyltransferase [Candidatus Eisenbacteria bacterium]